MSSNNGDDTAAGTASNAATQHVTATASALIVSAADKAGMEGIDRARIDEIILRESADSNYMKQQRKRDAAVNERIERMKKRLAERDGSRSDGKTWREAEERRLQPEINRLMITRRRLSTCVVVDMDAFYMSCELLTRPDLQNVPACVGSGMILTSNYCARRYGVRSAMAGWIGDKLVEELSDGKEKLVHVPSNYDLYAKKAHEVREVLAQYDPKMRAYSLDECYMDIGPYLSLRTSKGLEHEQVVAALTQADGTAEAEGEDGNGEALSLKPTASSRNKIAANAEDEENDDDCGDNNNKATHLCTDIGELSPEAALKAAADIVDEMRKKVTKATGGLTCSAGLANNFMLAKIASDRNKPDGQCIVGPSNESILNFIRPLSVRKVPGVGRVTEKILNAFNINTVQDLYDQRALVQFTFSKQATAGFLLRRSIGWTDSDSKADDDETGNESLGQKGISKERTFQPGKTWTEINSKLEDIAHSLSSAMKRKDIWSHTITLKCKLHTFDVLTRSKSMARGVYLQSAQDIIPIVAQILADLKKEHKGGVFSVRLLGIRASNFREESDSRQPDIQSFLTKKSASSSSAAANSPKRVDIDEKQDDYDEGKASSVNCKSTNDIFSSPYARKGHTTTSSPRNNTSMSPPVATTPPPDPACTNTSTSSDMQVTTCPICSVEVAGDNDALNRHVDSCLNASTVRRLAKDESTAADERAKKRRVLRDFFNT
mmetsp:Transcript_25625/g.56086  ORF Transcript_25625/g.56086 Transcript_25625/m.56086 type:complete len:719 (-) Transcript_25625:12-2168(-)